VAGRIGRPRAQQALAEVAAAAAGSGTSFRASALADARLVELLGTASIEAALQPESYLGAADNLVDRALSAYEDAMGVPR